MVWRVYDATCSFWRIRDWSTTGWMYGNRRKAGEQRRVRRDRDWRTCQNRLARHREYEQICWYAAMITEQQHNLRVEWEPGQRDQQSIKAQESMHSQNHSHKIPSFDHPSLVQKMMEFHNSPMSLASVKCSICLDWEVPQFKSQDTGWGSNKEFPELGFQIFHTMKVITIYCPSTKLLFQCSSLSNAP